MGEKEKLKRRAEDGGARTREGGARTEGAITSTSNARVKRIVELRDKRERDRTGLMLVEGARELARAIASGVAIECFYVCPPVITHHEDRALLASLPAIRAPIVEVSPRVFEKIAYRGGTGGLLAVARQPSRSLSDLPPESRALFLVVDTVEKPGNLGAIVRSADGAGAAGVIVCDSRTDLYNPNAIRASIGTIFTVPCVRTEAGEAIRWLRETRARIVAAAPGAALPYTKIDYTSRCAIVVGAEDAGLTAPWRGAADHRVAIPMKGAADSLNVSATAAILLYEALRQRENA